MFCFSNLVFPRVFSSSFIQHEVVAQYSHLFTVRGLDQGLMPYMILAHLDVVPATDEGWKFPPFSGEEHSGYIYGRGALDDKSCVIVSEKKSDMLLFYRIYIAPAVQLQCFTI